MAGSKNLWIEFPPYKDVTDFPSLISGVNIPAIFWDNVEADGDDIALYDNAGNKLKRQLVSIDTVNKTMELYVKKTRSATSPTYIRLNYDDAAGAETNDTDVWESAAVTIDEGTGECVAMPVTRSATAPLTLTIATAGTFTVTVPAGASVTFKSDTATVTDSPKTLTANGSITVENTGNITMQVHGFVMVHHMNDDPDTSTIQDSTSNNNDGVKIGANEPIEANGLIGKSQSFDGNNDGIKINDLFAGDSSFTASFIVQFRDDTRAVLMSNYDDDTTDNWVFALEKQANYRLRIWWTGNVFFRTDANVVSVDTWHLVTFVRDRGDKLYIYVDGYEDHNNADYVDLGAYLSQLYLGRDVRVGNTNLYGYMDEARVSNIAESPAWIAATYQSLLNNAADYKVLPVYNNHMKTNNLSARMQALGLI